MAISILIYLIIMARNHRRHKERMVAATLINQQPNLILSDRIDQRNYPQPRPIEQNSESNRMRINDSVSNEIIHPQQY